MKIIRIENCGDCPYYYLYCDNMFFCLKKKATCGIMKEIPDWCPLEEENNE